MNFLSEEGEIQTKAAGHRFNRHKITIDQWHVSELTRTRQSLSNVLHVMDDWMRDDIQIHEELNENHYWGDSTKDSVSLIQQQKVVEWTQKILNPFMITEELEIGSGVVRSIVPWRNIGIVSHYFTMRYLFEYFMAKYNFKKSGLPHYGDHIDNGEIYYWSCEEPDRISILR